ncbi:MAG: SDR family oxidoreductase [Selenomonadaceae bacterium]|nr:SDR family oxidoreductase [Selenomonadaceae bacterium]
MSNKYVYSKFQAEELVLTAIGQGKLDGKIIRVGNLMRRISDGEFQINFSNNAYSRAWAWKVRRRNDYRLCLRISHINFLRTLQ